MSTIKFNDNITLKNVLCVSSFNLNLMFVIKITNSLNYCVLFTPHGCVLKDLTTERMIGSCKQHADLYYMSPLPNQAHASNILLRRVYNLHLHYYLSVKISFSFIIIVVFVPKLNKLSFIVKLFYQ